MKSSTVFALVLIVGLLLLAYYSGWIQVPTVPTAQAHEGAATIAFIVTYEDGTQDVFEAANFYPGRLAIYPMSLYVGGKKITGIDIAVKGTLNTGGRTVNSWSAQITQRIEIYKAGQNTPLTSSTGQYSKSGTSWANNEKKTLCTTTLTADQVEAAIRQYAGNGEFYIQVVAQVSLTVNHDQGTETLSGSGVGGLTVTMQNYAAMSLTVTVEVSPLY